MEKYYNENANKYIEDTINCDMSDQYALFLKYFKGKGKILDIGFGSGRDMMYFVSLDNIVQGIDPSINFVNNMKDKGYDVKCLHVEEMDYFNEFDGIWACASLLHINRENLNEVFKRCSKALKNNGIMYCSFKYGDFNGIIKERYFNYLNEELLKFYLKGLGLKIQELTITNDVRNERKDERWLNIILSK